MSRPANRQPAASKPGPASKAASARLHQGTNGTSNAVPSTSAAMVATATTAVSAIDRQQESWIKARQIYQQQLLTEHFGFSPLSFVDDVINSVNNMIYQASMALQEFIESEMQKVVAGEYGPIELPQDMDPMTESAKGMHKFETLLEAAVDKNFDRFELYALKNLFGVPEDVDIILPHYESLDFGISVEREEKLDNDLELVRRQLIATKALNYRLRKELEIEENRRRQLEKCRLQIQFLKDAVKEVEPVPQTMIFVRDNIETLHRRFQTLHETLLRTTRPNNASLSIQNANSARPPMQQPAPAESVSVALRETLVGMPPDLRAAYIRSVVRREIEDQLASVAASPPSSTPAVTVTLTATATATAETSTSAAAAAAAATTQHAPATFCKD
ncbi:hypothetical protein BGZ75_004386 [Mortierella antarctica]|nr:hypothetical protein BGZ67_002898 [Mortierella alpina]KAF9984053.1 hypothetical protein BGZ75_004386 [Mortierella antarctica]